MPWFATSPETGEPLPNQDELYESVRTDLEEALDHEFDEVTFDEGETRFFTYGMVTLVYICTLPLVTGWRTYCRWREKFVSHGGTVLWLRTVFVLYDSYHYIHDEVTCYET